MFEFIKDIKVREEDQVLSEEEFKPLSSTFDFLVAKIQQTVPDNTMYVAGGEKIRITELNKDNFPHTGFMLVTATPEALDKYITSGDRLVPDMSVLTMLLISPDGSAIISKDKDSLTHWYAGYEDDFMYLADNFDELL